MIKKIFLISLLPLIFAFSFGDFGFSSNRGKQGEWKKFNYTAIQKNGSGEIEKNIFDFEIIVTDSNLRNEIISKKYLITVYWKGKNIAKRPLTFSYVNKVLQDKDGRLFSPISGSEQLLQPLEESEILEVQYEIPSAADVSKLNWGSINLIEENLYFTIELDPTHM